MHQVAKCLCVILSIDEKPKKNTKIMGFNKKTNLSNANIVVYLVGYHVKDTSVQERSVQTLVEHKNWNS